MRKKHPILLGFFLLIVVCMGFFLVVYGMSAMSARKHAFAMNDRVGIVTVEGIISDASETIEQLRDFDKDESVKAIVVRVDSPGGAVAPSQEIYEAILKTKKNKKLIASMGSVAASGGYMVACAADKIIANPGTITGSISAVMYFADAEELLKKIGLKTTVVKSGKFKDIGSPARGMTSEEKALIQGLVDDIFDQFLDTVSLNRKISKEDLRKIADGRVFSGRQAKKLGLVDYIGDMSYAVDLAGKMSGIQGTPDVVYPKKKAPKLWEYLLGDMMSAIDGKIKMKTQKLNGVHYMFMPSLTASEELLSR